LINRRVNLGLTQEKETERGARAMIRFIGLTLRDAQAKIRFIGRVIARVLFFFSCSQEELCRGGRAADGGHSLRNVFF